MSAVAAFLARDLRHGDRFRPASGRAEPLHVAHSDARPDGVTPGVVRVRVAVEGVDGGAPFDGLFLATAELVRAEAAP